MKRFVIFASFFLTVLLASAYQMLANPNTLAPSAAQTTTSPSTSPSSQVWTFESQFDVPRHLLQSYYEALREGQFKLAYLLWDQAGAASGSDFKTFSMRFQELKDAQIIFSSTGEMGEAEGFRYFKQPVTITTKTHAGETKSFNGEYTLRQPADAEVSEAWHIYNVSYQRKESASGYYF